MDKKPEGRPTKYDPQFVEEAYKYIQRVSVTKNELPTVEGFAISIGVDADTVNNWSKRKLKDENGNVTKKLMRPEFFGAIKRIKNFQHDRLIQDGLYGGKEVNSIMAIFLLKCNHGMVETSRTELTGKNGKELPAPILGATTNVPKDNSNQQTT